LGINPRELLNQPSRKTSANANGYMFKEKIKITPKKIQEHLSAVGGTLQ
jgi:hypothetical protein